MLFLSPISFAADDMALPSCEIYTKLKQSFKRFNEIRSSNSKDFEKTKIAESTIGLPQEYIEQLKTFNWTGEFSDRQSTEFLLQKTINLSLNVLNDADVQTLEGGFVSGDIYKVKATSQNGMIYHYFIKYLRTKPILVSNGRCVGEQENLGFLGENKKIAEINTYLKITLPEAICKYKYKGEEKVCMILPAAAGQSFSDIVKSNDPNLINAAFMALGTALGKMHTQHRFFQSDSHPTNASPRTATDFLNTFVLSHGDLHGQNVFYDPLTGMISFIDVETMANSFDKDGTPSSPICYDILYMLLMSPGKFGAYMPDNGWRPFKEFLDTYIQSYATEERSGIYDYLIDCFSQATSIKFVDIFKLFKWKKGISDQKTVDGAEALAAYVKSLKKAFDNPKKSFVPSVYKSRSPSLSRRARFSGTATDAIDDYYERLGKTSADSSHSVELVAEPSSPSVSVLRKKLAQSGVLNDMHTKRGE
jgi:hypothetical protein